MVVEKSQLVEPKSEGKYSKRKNSEWKHLQGEESFEYLRDSKTQLKIA